MMIGLVVAAALIAIVDAARSDSTATGAGLTGRDSTHSELCAAYNAADSFFIEQAFPNSPEGFRSVQNFVDVASHYPNDGIRRNARSIRAAAASGSLSNHDWWNNTEDVRVAC